MFGRFGNIEEPPSGSLIDLEKFDVERTRHFNRTRELLSVDQVVLDNCKLRIVSNL